ncbi:MAG: MotA/TolQ/ExbB proton channel family protein [Oscillospiraceae bacterium]|nr:MotA/TolQ/ExbB proton channel family protein [Oscillospiraceae bacterium]
MLIFVGMLITVVATVLGIVLLGGSLGDFLDPASFLLVIIPTFCSLLSNFPMELLAGIPKHFKVMMRKNLQPEEFIAKIVDCATLARKEGLLSLESVDMGDKTMQYALNMIVDGIDQDAIRESLEDSLTGIKERHAEVISLYEKAGSYAPAFGMVGTVVSLVNMLKALDFSNPDAINSLGGNMAAALITTLYGSLFANIIFLPLAGYLKVLHKREIFYKVMMCNGMLSVARGDNPKLIQDALLEQVRLSEKSASVALGGTGDGGGKESG